MCTCRRPLEATQTVPKALSEPAVALDHRTDPPDPLGAVSGRSELPDGRYARMSQIDQVNIVPCFRLLRQPRGCAAIRREHTTYGRIPRARVTRKSDRRRALGGFYGCYGTYQCVTKTAEHGPVRMNYSQDVADTTYLSAQNPL